MTEETVHPEAGADAESIESADGEGAKDDLQGRIAQLEEEIISRDSEIAAMKESLKGAVVRYRAAVLAGTPGVPQELIKGSTVEEIDASLELARRIVSRVREHLEAEATARSVPAGSPPRTAADLSGLSAEEKIAYALARQQT